jgi:hypothetical protein
MTLRSDSAAHVERPTALISDRLPLAPELTALASDRTERVAGMERVALERY